MPIGLRVDSDTGIMQIDQDYLNFGMRSKGTATCNQVLTSDSDKRWTSIIITNATHPLIAVHYTGELALYRISVSGSTWTFFYMGPANQAFEWFAFDLYPTPTGTAGLEVYTSTGALAFSTSANPAKIVAVGQTFTGLTSGRKYGVVQAASSYRQEYNTTILDPFGRHLYESWMAGAHHNGNINIYMDWLPYEQYFDFFLGPNVTDPLPGSFLLDVTGY